MTMKPLPIYLLTAGLLIPSFSWAAADAATPLKIIGKSLVREAAASPDKAPQQESTSYVLSLRNDSQNAITAWTLTCLYAEGDGNFATTRREQDSFMRFEQEQGDFSKVAASEPAAENAPIYPRGVLDIVIPRNERLATGLYGAMSCRVDAVILDDGSSFGVSSAVDRFFEGREKIAADARQTIDILSLMVSPDQTGSERSSAEALAAELARGDHWFSEVLEQADQAMKAEGSFAAPARASELLSYVQAELARIERHLERR